jgi:hypothetical protein
MVSPATPTPPLSPALPASIRFPRSTSPEPTSPTPSPPPYVSLPMAPALALLWSANRETALLCKGVGASDPANLRRESFGAMFAVPE